MDTHNTRYIINIYERYSNLIKSNKIEFDNNDLWKIFEYYCCIKLSEEYNKIFYEYDDIDPTFKELNKMTRNDTGIDLCDLENIIVQCKLRKNNLTWKDCATFFGSQNIFNIELNKTVIRWEQLIIARNSECILSQNLLERKELFVDKSYIKQELISFCENLMLNPPIYPVINTDIKLRDYQIEAITMITENKKNVIINLPTGTGKNTIIINSFQAKKKYLILVPRIILMDQLKDEIIKHNPSLKSKLQLIGDANNEFKENKLITICVFNSVGIIENYANTFEKIYIDEAHHINKPYIYCYDDEKEEECIIDTNDKEEEDEVINTNDNNINEYTDEEEDDGVINTDDNNINEYTDDEYTDDEYIEDEQDDIEDELKDVKTYTQIIKSFVQYNNNVYLSATIDKIDDFEYYSKDIRDMIELKYLCDYTVHIPIFSDDPDNKKICEHLLKNYKNIIIYCNSQKEGKQINELMNKLQLNSSDYIDCKTPKKKRNIIIDKYKKGQISFLVNVRILVEGFDAPVTSGVMFLHMPTSKTTLIQIIGRCLRLHPTKNIANIILPFSSNDDEKNIGAFLKVIAKNDSRIKKSFQNKTLGGYISIDVENDDNVLSEDIEFRYNMVYSSLGVLENGEGIFLTKLDELKRYIDKYGKRPIKESENINTKKIGTWLSNQQKNYKNKLGSMKNKNIYNMWTHFITSDEYKQYFLTNQQKWNNNLELIKQYIDTYSQRPNTHSKDKNIKHIGQFILDQQKKYKNKRQIMKYDDIYNKWTEFITSDKYKKYFLTNEEEFYKKYNLVIKYIELNNHLPSSTSKYENIKKLGAWVSNQNTNYKNKQHIMMNVYIYNKWTEFINNPLYINYFRSKQEHFITNLELTKQYININNKLPSSYTEDIHTRKLNKWISHQQTNHKSKKKLHKNESIYNKWNEFINNPQYIKYFQSNEDTWNNTLKNIIEHINKHHSLPTNKNNQYLCSWIQTQKQNYKNKQDIMKNESVYCKWTNFINDPLYIKYFQSNEKTFNDTLNTIIEYINKTNRLPSSTSKHENIKKMGNWIQQQNQNYKNKKNIMNTELMYNKWTEFINNPSYKKFFQSDEHTWNENLDLIKKYYDEYNIQLSRSSKNENIKKLACWLTNQKTKYKNKQYIMTNIEIYNKWTEFINDPQYKKYFTNE